MQKMLLGTKRPTSEEDILERLMLSIQGIPEAKIYWHGAEWRIEAEKPDLKVALPILSAAEKLNPEVHVYNTSSSTKNTSINAANIADNGKNSSG